MNKRASEFLEDISTLSPAIAKARDETIAYWSPDQAPITIAFAEIGHALVVEIETLDDDKQQIAFQKIEDGITSDDEQLSTAVATGLIEAIVGHATKRGNFASILAKLGPQSRSHAEVWHDG